MSPSLSGEQDVDGVAVGRGGQGLADQAVVGVGPAVSTDTLPAAAHLTRSPTAIEPDATSVCTPSVYG
jgi:hypothetical protein